jgi:serine protease Do
MNGKPIERSSDLPILVAETPPGEKADLEIWRKGAARHVVARIGERKDEKVAMRDGGSPESGKLGLAVRPLTRDERQQIDAKDGLVVEDASGPAAKAGIQEGDVVLALNGQPVKSPEQLRELVAKGGRHLALLVQRNDSRIFVPVELG